MPHLPDQFKHCFEPTTHLYRVYFEDGRGSTAQQVVRGRSRQEVLEAIERPDVSDRELACSPWFNIFRTWRVTLVVKERSEIKELTVDSECIRLLLEKI